MLATGASWWFITVLSAIQIFVREEICPIKADLVGTFVREGFCPGGLISVSIPVYIFYVFSSRRQGEAINARFIRKIYLIQRKVEL